MTRPSVNNVLFTHTIACADVNQMKLLRLAQETWDKMPDEDLEGGNDKSFFTIEVDISGNKEELFVVYTDYRKTMIPEDKAHGEVYTIMFSADY